MPVFLDGFEGPLRASPVNGSGQQRPQCLLDLDLMTGAGYVRALAPEGSGTQAGRNKLRRVGQDVDAKLIFDVGVHQGEDTQFYLQKGFRVVGIEADPSLYQSAHRSLRKYIDDRRLTLLNIAVSADDGEVTFYRNLGSADWGTTFASWAARNQRIGAPSVKIAVRGLRFEKILERFGIPYYLKVDIEGADLLCIQALKQFKDRPKYVSIESTKTSWEGLLEEFTLLQDLGYRRFKVVPQHRVQDQVCFSPAREGDYISHQFCLGSSGSFGEEAPGTWAPASEAIGAYKRIFRKYRWFGDDSRIRSIVRHNRLLRTLERFVPNPGWYDTHAAL